MNSNSVFLDIDSSIVENNLRFTKNIEEEDELSKFFGQSSNQGPSKLIKPFPGFCIKSKEIESGVKVFINICHTDAIPPPENISEEELLQLINSEEGEEDDVHFKVPMSIGDVRPEIDKKGENAKACDIAINEEFFEKVESKPIFKTFLLAIVFEGLKNKHKLLCTSDRIQLKNIKAYGTLQLHRVRQKEIDEKMGKTSGTPDLIQELSSNTYKPKPMIETISTTYNTKEPEYRLFKKNEESDMMYGEFKFPDVLSGKELTLDIGEDRILLESKKRGYLLDIFVPHYINQELVSSNFNTNTKILTVTMPVIKS